MPAITSIEALEVLDSRGHPTVQVEVGLADGTHATAGVPAGASTGSGEAAELRDEEEDRFAGRGALAAVGSVRRQVHDLLMGRHLDGLDDVLTADEAIADLDGTGQLSRLGANSAIGVSIALTRAAAMARGVPVWQLIQQHLHTEERLPVPHFNVVNGGAHAANDLDFQEFMIAPVGSPSFVEALRAGAEIYATLRRILVTRGHSVGLGDEGGFAPAIDRPEDVLTVLVEAIEGAGYRAGRDGVAIALDPAANGFAAPGGYRVAGEELAAGDLIDRYADLVDRFPIWSIEDGVAEDDTAGWKALTERLGESIQLVGDDNFVTSAERVRDAAARGVGNACLIKPNQVGSIRGTLETVMACNEVGYAQMVSHRSGETVDSFIADLAAGIGCGQLKSGAPARGERVAKYNRLLEIEHHSSMSYGLRRADSRG